LLKARVRQAAEENMVEEIVCFDYSVEQIEGK
jgi:hypothetical protein